MNILYKIKKWIRKKIVIWKYKHNYDTGKLIHVRIDDRGFGLTTMIIKDAIKYDIPILVPTLQEKYYMANAMYMNGQLGLSSVVTEKYAFRYLVVVPTINDLKGRRIEKILVDNCCNENDVEKALSINSCMSIMNGFVREE